MTASSSVHAGLDNHWAHYQYRAQNAIISKVDADIESRITGTTGVQVRKQPLKCTGCWEVGKKRRVLPMGETCGPDNK
jgi:hypothetical protein